MSEDRDFSKWDAYALAGVLLLVLALSSVFVLTGSFGAPPPATNDNQSLDEVPEGVVKYQSVGEDLYREVNTYFDARVFITAEGGMVVSYNSSAESSDTLMTEFHQIAELYAGVVSQSDVNTTTLSIVTDTVEAIVPSHTVEAYVEGDINQEAFHETIEVTEIERNG